MKFNTALLHGAAAADPKTGATQTPIYQTASFAHRTAEELSAVFAGRLPGYLYTRSGNPTVEALEKRMAALEGGVGAVACASGMAAVALSILNIVRSGDEIVAGGGLFGGTLKFLDDLAAFGVRVRYAGGGSVADYQKEISGKTRVIFTESIGNPRLDVPDIKALAGLACRCGVPLIVDNTAATPFLFRPIEWGADIVVHSATKYIDGGGNSIGGVIIDSGRFHWDPARFPAFAATDKLGEFSYLAKLRSGLLNGLGACMAPFNAYLIGAGLDTLGLRMQRLCENAAALAAELARDPRIVSVNYPGLVSSPGYQTASRQFHGRYGALLTIRVGSAAAAYRLIDHLKYAVNLANIGDARTLVIHPASTIYRECGEEEKERAGVYDDLIRISVGLEDIGDICEDFHQAARQM